MKVIELANILIEMKEQLEIVIKQKDDNKKLIIRLEQEVIQLNGQVTLLQTLRPNVTAPPGITKPQTVNHTSSQPLPQDPQQQPQQLQQPRQPLQQALVADLPPTKPTSPWKEIQPQTRPPTNIVNKQSSTAAPRSNTNGHVTQVQDDHHPNQWVTVLHKSRSLPSDVVSQVKEGRQPDLPHHHSTSPRSSTPTLHGYQRHVTRTSQPGLRGQRQEQGSALYVSGIAVDNESDDEVGEMVKDHLRQSGVRVMKFKIIRLRAVHDVVGCRIIVPQSQEHIPLNPDIWPDQYVKCRRGERAETYYKNRNNGYENEWYEYKDNGQRY